LMEQYLRRSRLSEVMDSLGTAALIYGAATLWFTALWGLRMPTLLAGLALGTLGLTARVKWRQRTFARREKALRRQLGAELAMEELLLCEAQEAHARAAQLLSARWPLEIECVRKDGALCRQGEEKLLVVCLRMPAEAALSGGDLAACMRAVRRSGADRGILCVTGRTPPKVAAQAEQAVVPLRLVARETLLALAGAMHPATDAQLVALGQRRRSPAAGGVLQLVFRRDKARRYFGYGLAMTLMYVAMGVRVCAVAGMVCLTMAVLCHTGRREAERL